MAVPGSAFAQGDVYIDFPQEEVMFRYDHKTKKVFRKFYDQAEEDEIPYSNNLFNEARRVATQTTAEHYQNTKPQSPPRG